MMEHIVQTSSRPDALVLDCFAGSGVVGEACRNFGRRAILCEIESRWFRKIRSTLSQKSIFPSVDVQEQEEAKPQQQELFGGVE